MAMPQRDNAIEEIKRLDILLEYAVWSFPHLYKCGNGDAVRDCGIEAACRNDLKGI